MLRERASSHPASSENTYERPWRAARKVRDRPERRDARATRRGAAVIRRELRQGARATAQGQQKRREGAGRFEVPLRPANRPSVLGGGPYTSVASLFATHSFASGRNLCGHDALGKGSVAINPAKWGIFAVEGRSGAKKSTRREPLEEPSAPAQAPSRTGRRASHLGGLALCVSTFASKRRNYPAPAPSCKAVRGRIPAICGEIRGARCVSRTPETTSAAAITVARGQRLAEQQRREAEPEDRHQQGERGDRPGRVRAQQEGPQAPARESSPRTRCRRPRRCRRGRSRPARHRPAKGPRTRATGPAAAAAARRRSRS